MSDVQAFLDQCDDVLADWEGSADSATWTADGGHEEARRLARHATLRAAQRVVCDTCRTDLGYCLTFRTGGQVILWNPRVVDTGHHCGEHPTLAVLRDNPDLVTYLTSTEETT